MMARAKSSKAEDVVERTEKRGAVSTSSEHGRITVYVPEALKRWCKVEAISRDMTLSDLLEEAIREYKERHSRA